MTTYLNSKYNAENTEQLDNSTNVKDIHQFQLILLGDIAVGKSAILKRFVDDDFTSDYFCTVGVEFNIKTIQLSDSSFADLKIWDTCGEEKYRTITRQYYTNCDGVVLVFDLTNKISFTKLDSWIEDIANNAPEDVGIIIVGNKKDLKDSIEVDQNMISEYFKKHNELNYVEVSALTGEGVGKVFEEISKELIKKKKNRVQNIESDNLEDIKHYNLEKANINNNNTNVKKEGCC